MTNSSVVAGGRNGSEATTVTIPVSDGVTKLIEGWVRDHMDDLRARLALIGVDADRLMAPEWMMLARVEDLRLIGDVEPRRRFVAKAIADISQDASS